ncbi:MULTISPECIES: PAS domain-containing sensor histidine kinase [unclassified Sphingobium]|uniref:hybrid sensor histidine kinase/response regulator n=1 Tax=unclassified Sphingobium TaxID=2611147 RepID=UPI00119A0033|nr:MULTISPECIES: PAS domain-containing sensor histidine kinase [unclassified Sphingobium]MBG6120260.1 PAS domain S-box-containing protein [Sphingobium sp. JAI105]TWC96173.1 PAS domain S-box-containing protein [Sphingobium sp. AEW010]TWD15140.1 PAS domain S-box-containing protein [Sphingobium sp. AEW013]TWD19178.1 PAS domain S-box-containing protein [Sphingobium sp. AEW001]
MNKPKNQDVFHSEQRFRLLVESVSDYAIYMLDPDGQIATWNAGAKRFKGYEADEIIGQNFSRFFTQEDRDAGLPGHILATAAKEGRYENEGRRVRKDGSEIWVHVVVDPIRDPDGVLLGFAKITRDITERRRAAHALFRSEQQFRMLVQGVHDYAICMLDLDGRITNWNAGAQLIKGYSADEIIGEHFSRFYTDEDRANGEPARALETALAAGRYEREAQRIRKDGTLFWAHVVIDPIRDETGEVVGFAKITRDITEKRHAQEELEQAQLALFQSQKLQALGELTGGIAHDFNNLMTVVRGSAELLKKRDLLPERHDRYVDAILETADRAAALTSKLLAFARRQTLKPEPINVAVRLDAWGEVLARTLGIQIEVVIEVAPDVWPIEADVTELENALLNAAFNARDAMPEGGRLTIGAANVDNEDCVALTISDTGQGIPQDLLDRIFEPFFTTKPEGKGTGLGLSQIHGFAAQTGGRTTIASQVGVGTTITLILPRARAMPADRMKSAATQVRRDQLDVLLVEDNDQVREFARSLLEDIGARVTEADCAEAAAVVAADHDFDLVFSDIVMPGKSGLDLAQELRERRPGQRVLLATGFSSEVAQGVPSGIPVIQKPYGATALAAAIDETLTGSI